MKEKKYNNGGGMYRGIDVPVKLLNIVIGIGIGLLGTIFFICAFK